ncbi:hypothetical protein FisN_16Hh194 [Fistulifera solaris]|jgi:thiamine kinase-like enzyme|uniref:Ethanolamine kinase n=1 Tax=Fistulifera solaris TaxID=1519565 RepID=A0A1Z5KTQ9_FISSO|nr:hypothetical protein FisN_16Hh194 [Fistulifera solaris]|eukprot:GAX29368.1 hypothetical protein FisN_16Hh194 [Fistulifera solaris]
MLLLRNSTKTSTRLVLPYEIRLHTAHRDEQLTRLVAEAFALNQQSLRIQPLTGGLSNSLFVAYHQQQPVALIRVHPDPPPNNSRLHHSKHHPPPFIDHRTETKLLRWLSQQHHLAPKLYGSFQNGRLEEFYPHHQPLSSCRDMIKYAPLIAQRMAQLHALPQEIVTISCQERTRQWLTLAESLVVSHEKELTPLLQTLQHEWQWIESVLFHTTSAATPAQSFLAQRVLTHGDLQSLNVLVHQEDPTDVRIIDYEYASYSPRGFDLANTFCEYCDMNHLRADYEREYPTTTEQKEFLRSYLHTLGQPIPSEEYLQELGDQVGRYTVVSHISWAIWSIVQHFQSAQRETFDYLQYARHRLEGNAFSKRRFWDLES